MEDKICFAGWWGGGWRASGSTVIWSNCGFFLQLHYFPFYLHFTLHYISFLHYQWKETTINLAILHKEINLAVFSRQNSHISQALSTASKKTKWDRDICKETRWTWPWLNMPLCVFSSFHVEKHIVASKLHHTLKKLTEMVCAYILKHLVNNDEAHSARGF